MSHYKRATIKVEVENSDGKKMTSGIAINEDLLTQLGILRGLNVGWGTILKWLKKRDEIQESLPYLETLPGVRPTPEDMKKAILEADMESYCPFCGIFQDHQDDCIYLRLDSTRQQ